MNYQTLIKLLGPLLTAISRNLPASTPPYVALLVTTAVQLLDQFVSTPGLVTGSPRSFGVGTLPHELPPEHEWTSDGLARWAMAKTEEEP